ncbi:MAG: sel1 repeat family protein [Proteobacteria bacterium]|nr:sel1 repeat family protein [Pseudomonadota bacterium]
MRWLVFIALLVFSVSACAGEDEAYEQYALGGRYLVGEGVPQDERQAVALFRKASDQGLAIAQYYLSRCYAGGKGVVQDEAEAYFWIVVAARGGDKFILDYRDELSNKLTRMQIGEIERRAAAWKPVVPAIAPK